MSLVTRCPKCVSEFEVTADQLKLHDGLVRCGQCSHVFDGFANLKDSLPTLTRKVGVQPADAPSAATSEITLPEAPTTDFSGSDGEQTKSPFQQTVVTEDLASTGMGRFVPSVDAPTTQGGRATDGRYEPALSLASGASASIDRGRAAFSASKPEDMQTAAHEADFPIPSVIKIIGESRLRGDDPSAYGRTVPEFLEDDESESPTSSVLWVLGSIILALVLLGQALIVFRDDIASAVPQSRPWLSQACQLLGCKVGYVRDIERVFILGSALQQAPNAQANNETREYVLRLTLQNRATHPQPWPALMVALNDASGTVVIRKVLSPEQYLPVDSKGKPFAARQEISVEIPVSVKGMTISGYELEKFFP